MALQVCLTAEALGLRAMGLRRAATPYLLITIEEALSRESSDRSLEESRIEPPDASVAGPPDAICSWGGELIA